MGKILGGGSKSTSSSTQRSGYAALPQNLQDAFDELASAASPLLSNYSDYFAPMDITPQETAALGLIESYQDPATYRQNIETLLSPYRGIITEDINKAFQDPYSALKSRASEAGAFGSSRMRQEEADLENARLDAITMALQNQYNVAQGQQQQNIGNLLGFGSLERGVDLQQRMALPTALGAYSSALSPLLSTSYSSQTNTQKSGGGLGGALSGVAGLASGISGLGSGLGLWGGYDPFSGITWNSGRR